MPFDDTTSYVTMYMQYWQPLRSSVQFALRVTQNVKILFFWKSKKNNWNMIEISGFDYSAPVIYAKQEKERYWVGKRDFCVLKDTHYFFI